MMRASDNRKLSFLFVRKNEAPKINLSWQKTTPFPALYISATNRQSNQLRNRHYNAKLPEKMISRQKPPG